MILLELSLRHLFHVKSLVIIPFWDLVIRQSYLSFVVRDIYSDLLTEKTFRCIITIIVCFHSDKNELSMGKIYARWVTLPNGLGKLVG